MEGLFLYLASSIFIVSRWPASLQHTKDHGYNTLSSIDFLTYLFDSVFKPPGWISRISKGEQCQKNGHYFPINFDYWWFCSHSVKKITNYKILTTYVLWQLLVNISEVQSSSLLWIKKGKSLSTLTLFKAHNNLDFYKGGLRKKCQKKWKKSINFLTLPQDDLPFF